MNIHAQADIWIRCSMILLSSIVAVGASGAIILAILSQHLYKILNVLGAMQQAVGQGC